MAIYRNGKKATGIYRNGKALAGVYRGGKKLFGIGEPAEIKGLVLEATGAADELDLHYALRAISGNQREYYVDLLLGVKTLRLAGDMTGRIKGVYKNGTLTWSGVKITDENLYIGKLLDVKVKYGASEVLYDSATYPESGRAVYDFKDTHVASNSSFVTHVRLYSNGLSSIGGIQTSTDAMAQRITVNGEKVANANAVFPDVEKYTYVAKGKYSAGTFTSATMSRPIFMTHYALFHEPQTVSDEVTFKNLVATRQNEVKIVTPAVDKTIQLKVKGIIK